MIQNILRRDVEVEFEGATVVYIGEWDLLNEGDTYMAERNVGPQLLTVDRVDREIGCVFPKEVAYPYDLYECVKVEIKFKED